MSVAATLRKTSLWVLAVQCLLALSWTLYVLFLPGLLATAGIARNWFVYVLIADQMTFALCDWAAGVYADRIAFTWLRIGRILTAVALVSSAALLAMPWFATAHNAPLLLATIFVWVATSSALRAPVFALLGRIRGLGNARQRTDVVSMALVGISLAGAIGPFLTTLLKGLDSRLPIALSAVALALASLWATRAERILPAAQEPDARGASPAVAPFDRGRALRLAGIVLVAAFGTQLLTSIIAQPLYRPFVGDEAVIWTAWFWAGFGVGLVPAAPIAAGRRPLIGAALALVAAIVALSASAAVNGLTMLVVTQIIAGAAWGVFSTVAFSSALSLNAGRAAASGTGTASGMLFSALALAALARLAIVAGGLGKHPFIAWLPELSWVVACVLLLYASRREAGNDRAAENDAIAS